MTDVSHGAMESEAHIFISFLVAIELPFDEKIFLLFLGCLKGALVREASILATSGGFCRILQTLFFLQKAGLLSKKPDLF